MKSAAIALLLLAIPAARAEDKADYSDFARFIHNLVVPLVPPQFEVKTDWGKTVPLPPNLRLPRARRTIVMVDGRPETDHRADGA